LHVLDPGQQIWDFIHTECVEIFIKHLRLLQFFGFTFFSRFLTLRNKIQTFQTSDIKATKLKIKSHLWI